MAKIDLDLKEYLEERFKSVLDLLERLEGLQSKTSDAVNGNSARLDRHDERIRKIEDIVMPRMKNNGYVDRFDEVQTFLSEKIAGMTKKLFIYMTITIIIAVALKDHWGDVVGFVLSIL